MKVLLCFVIFFGSQAGISQSSKPNAASADTAPRLSNQDVMELASLGLSDDVIIQKITNSRSVNFDTSIDGLKSLKAANVSGPVIKAMLAQEGAIAASSPDANVPSYHSSDGKVRVYVTDHPMNEVVSIIRGASASGVKVDTNSAHAGTVSTVGGVSHGQVGDDPRTVEIQADLQKVCPAYVMVSNNPARADYILTFRREGGKRSSFFALGGLTGLALSAASKVDGASLFLPNGDMIFATRENTVQKSIKASCGHIPPPQP